MKKWLVTNVVGTKGVIIEANDSHEAIVLAKEAYYSPFERKNDLCMTQVYEPNKHHLVRATGNTLFSHVQYNTMGGVATSYDCTIDTLPTPEQLAFLRKPIVYIKFFKTPNLCY